MDIRALFNKIFLRSYKKISIKKFYRLFSGTLYVAGLSLDSKVLDFITKLNLDRINTIIILTPFSNINKAFITSWSGLERYLRETNVNLIMKSPIEPIFSDIYFLDDKQICFIPRNYFDKQILDCCVCKDKEKRKKILKALASAEDFTSLKGTEVYHKKFDKIFEINERNLSENEKERILDALLAWETSNYEDIEPIWRIFELKIRNFITIRLKSVGPQNWFTTKVVPCFSNNPDIQDGIMKRFQNNKDRLNIQNIDDHPFPVEYLYAENYETIINNRNNRALFRDYRNNLNRKYKNYISDVIKARNAPLHSRTPDNEADYYSDTISKVLMSLEWLNEAPNHSKLWGILG